MFRSYWVQIGFSGAVLSAALAAAIITQPSSPSSHEREPQSEHDHASNTHPQQAEGEPEFRFYAPCPPEPEGPSKPDAPEPEASDGQTKGLTPAEADLLAQERVAHWTAWIGGFTAFGLFALIATLFETRQVTTVTREIGQSQVRAYLTVRPQHFWQREAKLGCTIEIKNVGATPASYVTVSGNVGPLNWPLHEDQGDLAIPAAEGFSNIPPGNSFENELQGNVFDPDVDMDAPSVICVYGVILYTDVFKRRHKYRFCYALDHGSVIRTEGNKQVREAYFEMAHRHNDET